MRHPNLLRRDDSVLVVVDVQAALLPAIAGQEGLLANVHLLVETAKILGIPTLITTQYAARLGESVVPGSSFDKLSFSCAGADGFCEALAETGRRQVLLCGVETHICVSQTAHDLLARGFQVNVAPDAVSSRTVEKHKLGMERMRDAGVLPVAAEAAVYEWLERAGTPEFKAILPLVKS